jgi:ADP-ribose pyrophosphatase
MCDPGEKISNTMKREFMEEALNSNDITEDELNDFKNKLSLFFGEGVEVILI